MLLVTNFVNVIKLEVTEVWDQGALVPSQEQFGDELGDALDV